MTGGFPVGGPFRRGMFRPLPAPKTAHGPTFSLAKLKGALSSAAGEAGSGAKRQAQAPTGTRQPHDFQLKLY